MNSLFYVLDIALLETLNPVVEAQGNILSISNHHKCILPAL